MTASVFILVTASCKGDIFMEMYVSVAKRSNYGNHTAFRQSFVLKVIWLGLRNDFQWLPFQWLQRSYVTFLHFLG